MAAKIGFAEGVCSRCGKVLRRRRPADWAVCDCYKFCPICTPPYTVPMNPYTPDLTSSTYGPIEGGQGDIESPLRILYYCEKHTPIYYSAELPVEVRLT